MKIIKEFMLMLEQRLTAWEHLINLLFREEFLAAERAALPEDAGGVNYSYAAVNYFIFHLSACSVDFLSHLGPGDYYSNFMGDIRLNFPFHSNLKAGKLNIYFI